MTRIAKLFAHVVANPNASLPFRDFERLLAGFGFTLARTRGSHRQYVHPTIARPFPVQPERGDAKRYQVRELLDMIEAHGLSIDE